MAKFKRLRSLFFRWNQLLILFLYSVPLLLISLLGFVWLFQNGWLLHFFILCLLLSVAAFSIRYLSKPSTRGKAIESTASNNIEVDPNPEWSEKEKHAFALCCNYIHQQTQSLQAWPELQKIALDVIQQVATHIGGKRKKALDFSAPEALLLIEQTASRYRDHLRGKMPFADQISLAKIYWLWQKRKNLSTAWKLADGGRRLARFAANPTGAAIKEIEQLINGGNVNYLSDQMLITLQTVLLEEVASVAVDLYSGRLKFSDAELLNIELASTEKDKARIAKPDDPVRVLIIGQVSSGKSSLLNHLLASEAAETDAASTTDKINNYLVDINGTVCHFLDSPGIDGSKANLEMLIKEINDSDMILWTLRADRPSRAVDNILLERLQSLEKSQPMRRQPVIVFIATFMDRLADQWPQVEHRVSANTQKIFSRVTAVIASDIKADQIIPISNAAPVWNVDVLASQIEFQLPEALMVQRNRRRLSGEHGGSLLGATKRSVSGVYQSVKFLSASWYNKQKRSVVDSTKNKEEQQ